MRRKLLAIIVTALVLCPAPIARAGQLGWRALDDGFGTIARDGSGKGNHGTLMNGPTWVDGKLRKAVSFDGVDDYVQVPHHAGLIPTTAAEGKALFSGSPPAWPKAKNPDPPNGFTGAITPLFQWEAGDGAFLHDVYVGTSPDLTEANRFAVHLPVAAYWHMPGLEPGVTYFWRVDEVAADMTITTGDVWSFTAAPLKAYLPTPPEGARNVVLDSKLSWAPGIGAVAHEVYLGTGREEVAAGAVGTAKGTLVGTTFDPGALTEDTVYYWRIDEARLDGSKAKGDVWSFRTLSTLPIWDPNLVGWWKLDEEAGTFVMDSSGRGNHGAVQGNPLWVAGYDRGALQLDGAGDYVEIPHSTTLTVSSEVAVMAWINVANLVAEYQGVIAKGNTVRSYCLYVQRAGTLYFSTSSAGIYVGSSSTGTVKTNEWVHVCAMVKGGGHQYFIDGEPAGTGASGIILPGAADTATVRLGNTQEDGRFFTGLIDDARVYNAALTQDKLKDAMRGDPLRARAPQPPHKAEIDVRNVEALTWLGGESAARHDVYFGTDKNAVAMADTRSPEYQGRQSGTSFAPAGKVEFGGVYFWRIDEVEADGSTIHRGAVWSFLVPSYLIIDDFEAYNDMEGGRIFDAWIDGYIDGLTGSVVGHGVAYQGTFGERQIVHGGRQSMPFEYNNVATPFYSEAVRTFAPLEDWTLYGVTDLSLRFRGQSLGLGDYGNGAPTNSAAGLYVAIEDSAGKSAIVSHPDPAATTIDAWTEWKIPLSRFADVNVAKVKKLYLGVGDKKTPVAGGARRIYIDDIHVTRP